MKYIVEEDLSNFHFWGGAKDNAESLTIEQLDQLEQILMDSFEPEHVPTETEINDLMWFEFDTIKEWLGVEEDDES